MAALAILPLGLAFAAPIAKILPVAVSPREVAVAPDDVFDEVASGLNVVGVTEKVYLEAHPEYGVTLGGANWELVGRPSGSAAAISAASGTLITLVPDVAGVYIVRLTPLNSSNTATETVDARIYAGTWVGAGVFNSHGAPDSTIPHCGNTCCHSQSDQPRLNIVDQWLGTGHAGKLQEHLSGALGPDYSISCLPCHTLGFKETANNGGFDDIAIKIGFDLAGIPNLVQEAASTHTDKWPELPAALQSHASIQCESCHGPGSNHLGNITEAGHGIGGVNLKSNACAQCHDSERPEGGQYYQWSESTHPITAELSEGHVADSDTCRICHTGEGFVAGRVNGTAIPQLPTHDYTSITCSTCHDPHGSTNEHQLRVAGDFTLPEGVVAKNMGNGGLCVRCHNSRIAVPETTASTSTRGAHYGTAGEVFTGAGAIDFGLPFVGNSAHTTITKDSCVDCHMAASPAGKPTVGGHTFKIVDNRGTPDESDDIVNAANACGKCHSDLQTTIDRKSRGDYDGDGVDETIQEEVDGLVAVLKARMLATYPNTSIDAASGKVTITSAGFAKLSADQKRALYNLNMVIVDGSHGVHNTSYIVQVLQRSYWGAFGHTITDDYPTIDLRGPVQISTLPTPTPAPTPVPTATPIATPIPAYLATVELLGVSPRQVAFDQTGLLDETASGLKTVGVGEKVYLQANKVDASVTGYRWSVFSAPAGSTATVAETTGTLATFRPDKKGTYVIRLTPLTTKKAIDVFDQRIYAANYAGAGVFDTHGTQPPEPNAPQCGTSFCHGGNNGNADLNVLDKWLKSNHSQKLQLHLNGQRGPAYSVSCLPCHTVGFNDHISAVNNGFDDIAKSLNFPLQNIVDLVQDAAANQHSNFAQLPAALQNHASVQCESCHGAGSLHPANLSASDRGIDGAVLDPTACARCHDSSHDNGSDLGQGFYQWSNSTHPITAELSEGHVAESDACRTCHTGEGFIAVRVKNQPIPQLPTKEYHGTTCAVCHDPHGSDNEHQLRVAGDFVMPNGSKPYGSGTGGICYRCHNTRIAAPEVTALSSTRGAHHGPQGEVFTGTAGVAFGLAVSANSAHSTAVPDSCATCHMAKTPAPAVAGAEPPQVGGHSFSMRDDKGTTDTSDDVINAQNACGSCHAGLNTYDLAAKGDYDGDGAIEGTQTEVEGLFTLVRTGFLAKVTGATVAADGRLSATTAVFNAMTADQKRAMYNYNMLWEDGSKGVHNTSYTVQLLQRSYFGATGNSILADYPNIYLRGPVQPVPVPQKEQWLLY